MYADENPEFIIKNYLSIILERTFKSRIEILSKYVLPAFIIFLIAVVIFMSLLFEDFGSLESLLDTLIGIVSIFFIFSLLVTIDSLLAMDLLYYGLISTIAIFVGIITMKRTITKDRSRN
jgi:hypothetical protein